jgi:hypothetical protein
MNDIDFSRKLIKGKIAEIIFEQMFRTSDSFSIFHFGYEYTLPALAQYQHLSQIKAVTDNIKDAPDFVLISKDNQEVYLVEVKYRHNPQNEENMKMAKALLKRWDPSFLFVASPEGFYFEPCNTIATSGGKMGPLFTKWATAEIQSEYLKLLREFELSH